MPEKISLEIELTFDGGTSKEVILEKAKQAFNDLIEDMAVNDLVPDEYEYFLFDGEKYIGAATCRHYDDE